MGRVVCFKNFDDTVCFKNFDEIALSSTVKETEGIWCFALFVTNLKIDNDPHFGKGNFFFFFKLGTVVCLHTQRNYRHFWRVKYLLKLGKASLHRYHVGQKVCRIHSIWHGFKDTSIFVFCNFCKKFDNSKWPPFLVGQKILKIGSATQPSYSMGQNFCVLHF